MESQHTKPCHAMPCHTVRMHSAHKFLSLSHIGLYPIRSRLFTAARPFLKNSLFALHVSFDRFDCVSEFCIQKWACRYHWVFVYVCAAFAARKIRNPTQISIGHENSALYAVYISMYTYYTHNFFVLLSVRRNFTIWATKCSLCFRWCCRCRCCAREWNGSEKKQKKHQKKLHAPKYKRKWNETLEPKRVLFPNRRPKCEDGKQK